MIERPNKEEIEARRRAKLPTQNPMQTEREKKALQEDFAELQTEHSELKETMETDSLTGLLNRAAFIEKVGEKIKALKNGTENGEEYTRQEDLFARKLRASDSIDRSSLMKFSFLLIDVDNFKYINDTFGHPVGDTALKAVANVLKRLAPRSSDFVGRWSGDEFAIGLLNADGIALQKAEEVRATIEAEVKGAIEQAHGIQLPADRLVTVSIGIAETTGERDVEKLYKRADEALYASKDQGKNRIIVSEGKGKERIPGEK